MKIYCKNTEKLNNYGSPTVFQLVKKDNILFWCDNYGAGSAIRYDDLPTLNSEVFIGSPKEKGEIYLKNHNITYRVYENQYCILNVTGGFPQYMEYNEEQWRQSLEDFIPTT